MCWSGLLFFHFLLSCQILWFTLSLCLLGRLFGNCQHVSNGTCTCDAICSLYLPSAHSTCHLPCPTHKVLFYCGLWHPAFLGEFWHLIQSSEPDDTSCHLLLHWSSCHRRLLCQHSALSGIHLATWNNCSLCNKYVAVADAIHSDNSLDQF